MADTLQTEGNPGHLRPAAAPSPAPQRPAPGSKATGKTEGKRPVKYPVQLRVNLTLAMHASLQRVCQRWGIPEGIGARIAITQFLAQQDPQYRGE